MAQHKSSMEKVMQSGFKHRRVGTEMATAVLGIEAMVESGIATTAVVENLDKKVQGRCRAAMCHKAFGKRLADAVTTLDQIIADESLTLVAEDKPQRSQHKAGLRKVITDEITRKIMGKKIADIVDLAEKAVDELIVTYALVPATLANLQAIKAIMEL